MKTIYLSATIDYMVANNMNDEMNAINARKPEVKETPNGLRYIVIKEKPKKV